MLRKICFLFAILSMASLQAEINELTLCMQGIDCSFCAKEIRDQLQALEQVEHVDVFPHSGIVSVDWKKDTQFHSFYLFQPFLDGKFMVKEASIDLQGVYHVNGQLRTIETQDGSLFHVESRVRHLLDEVLDGDTVRVRGVVTDNHGFNFLVIQNLLWRNPVSDSSMSLPSTSQIEG